MHSTLSSAAAAAKLPPLLVAKNARGRTGARAALSQILAARDYILTRELSDPFLVQRRVTDGHRRAMVSSHDDDLSGVSNARAPLV